MEDDERGRVSLCNQNLCSGVGKRARCAGGDGHSPPGTVAALATLWSLYPSPSLVVSMRLQSPSPIPPSRDQQREGTSTLTLLIDSVWFHVAITCVLCYVSFSVLTNDDIFAELDGACL